MAEVREQGYYRGAHGVVILNVFACDPSPVASAQALADRHVIKMVLETAQVLSTVAVSKGLGEGLYRPTHKNHPVVKQCIADPLYLGWTALHGLALAEEYQRRFERVHKSARIIHDAIERLSPTTPNNSIVVFPLVMPDEFKSEDPHESYQRYLRVKYRSWKKYPRWTRTTPPVWLDGDHHSLATSPRR